MKSRSYCLVIVTIFLLLAFSLPLGKVQGQSGSLDWSDPENVSNSGGATNPYIITGDEQVLLVLWDETGPVIGGQDPRSGVVLNTGDGWSKPTWVELPFSGHPTEFIVDEREVIHVAWIDQENELKYLSAGASAFLNSAGWGEGRILGRSVVAFGMNLDEEGGLQVAFITGDSEIIGPSGMYYTRSADFGNLWTAPIRLYESDYYSQYLGGVTLNPNPISPIVTNPSVDLEVIEPGENQVLVVSWDNPQLKRVFASSSTDFGGTWLPVEEVEGPDERSPYSSPRDLQTLAHRDTVIRTWQVVLSGGNCTQVFQASTDGGSTWSAVEPLLEDIAGCPESLQAETITGGDLLLIANFPNHTYLVAWNGQEWSELQNQRILTYFQDPATLNFVEFGCRTAALVGPSLFMAGCDRGEGGDIWITEAELQDTRAWFGPPSGWVEGGSAPLETNEIHSLAIGIDNSGVVHALLSHRETDSINVINSVIEYAGWEENGVVGPFPVHEGLPGVVQDLFIDLDEENGLSAYWSGTDNGEILSSRTSTQEAPSRQGWSDPVNLFPSGIPGRSPNVVRTAEGSYLVYAVPANENRGVYIATTTDGGLSWETSQLVFDSSAAECPLIEAPDPAVTQSGKLSIIWTCSTLPGGIGPMEVLIAQSEGQSGDLSAAEQIVQGQVIWSRLLGGIGQRLHFVWVEQRGDQYRTNHSVSIDAGQNWSTPSTLRTIDDEDFIISAVMDRAGQVHLMQAIDLQPSAPRLLYEKWWDGKWVEQESLLLRAEYQDEITALSASIGIDDSLVVAYVGPGLRDNFLERTPELVFAKIPIEFPSSDEIASSIVGEVPDEELEEPTAAPRVTEVAVEQPETFPVSDPVNPQLSTSPINIAALVIVVLSALIIVIVMVFRHRRVN